MTENTQASVPKLNIDLMRRVRDQIIAHPDKHDQRFWTRVTDCGTTRCWAGWAAHLQGWVAEDPSPWAGSDAGRMVRKDGLRDAMPVTVVAGLLLGLDSYEEAGLFYSADHEVLQVAAEIAANHGHVL